MPAKAWTEVIVSPPLAVSRFEAGFPLSAAELDRLYSKTPSDDGRILTCFAVFCLVVD